MSEYIVDFGDTSSAFVGLAMAQAINSGATINDKITRCRDCKHVDEIMTRYAGMQYACKRFDDTTVTPDGFCAWASRKEGGDD